MSVPNSNPTPTQRRQAVSRRRFLQAAALAGFAGSATAACGIQASGSKSASPSASSSDLSDTEKVLNWTNWIDYIDVDDAGNRPTLNLFKEQTGVTVNYIEDYNDNNEFYAKVRPQLESGQSIGRDLVTPTDWMSAMWLEKGYLAKIDKANTPNFLLNLGRAWRTAQYDPARDYTVPWQSGFGGIGWNKKLLKQATGKTELRTVDELWDPKLKGRITILAEIRESVGLILMSMGKRADNFTDADYEAAVALLQEQIDKGQIRQVTGNDYKAAMAAGEIIASIAWSGDMLNDPDTYGFAVPESGCTMFTDNLVIPATATHKKNAEKWIDFCYDPVNAARIAAYVSYITPVDGAQAEMLKIDPAQAENPAIFPTADMMKNVQVFMTLTSEQQSKYETLFQTLMGA